MLNVVELFASRKGQDLVSFVEIWYTFAPFLKILIVPKMNVCHYICCGVLLKVCSPEAMKVLQRNSRQSETLLKKLLSQSKPSDIDAAMAQRNRLLEYDRTR